MDFTDGNTDDNKDDDAGIMIDFLPIEKPEDLDFSGGAGEGGDDEFDYAFEGKPRDGKTHKREFVAKVMQVLNP